MVCSQQNILDYGGYFGVTSTSFLTAQRMKNNAKISKLSQSWINGFMNYVKKELKRDVSRSIKENKIMVLYHRRRQRIQTADNHQKGHYTTVIL
jgi:hypothetical protein